MHDRMTADKTTQGEETNDVDIMKERRKSKMIKY
jgi:hypothetical protein